MYNLEACEKLIKNYQDIGGNVSVVNEGVLGLGVMVLHDAPKKQHIIIKEVCLNEWSSGHTVRQYKKLPNKYLEKIY